MKKIIYRNYSNKIIISITISRLTRLMLEYFQSGLINTTGIIDLIKRKFPNNFKQDHFK